MRNMSHIYAKKYILPATIRKGYKIGGFFTLIGLLSFTLFMLGIGIKQDADKVPCFTVAGIFGLLLVGYLVIWCRNYFLIDATYDVDNSVVINCVDKLGIKVSVDFCSAMSIDYTHSFYIGKGSFNVAYTILFADASSASVVSGFEGASVYKALRKIWTSGSVIIPRDIAQGTVLCVDER